MSKAKVVVGAIVGLVGLIFLAGILSGDGQDRVEPAPVEEPVTPQMIAEDCVHTDKWDYKTNALFDSNSDGVLEIYMIRVEDKSEHAFIDANCEFIYVGPLEDNPDCPYLAVCVIEE